MMTTRHRVPPTVRALLLTRARTRCELCGQRIQPGQWDAHHRRQRSVGGNDELHNMLAVCRPCHDRIHADVGRARKAGWLVDSWEDPLGVAVHMHEAVFYLDGLGGLLPLEGD